MLTFSLLLFLLYFLSMEACENSTGNFNQRMEDKLLSDKTRVRYPAMDLPEGIKPVNALRNALSRERPLHKVPAGSMYLTDQELEEIDRVAQRYDVSRGTAIKLIIRGMELE